MRVSDRKGFSLIELMVVIAIIGILASIAIPMFNGFRLRSRITERHMMLRHLENGVLIQLASHDQFPTVAGINSTLIAELNPPAPIRPEKKPAIPGTPGWSGLPNRPEGMLHFHYEAFGVQTPGLSWFYVAAHGDLDGDGVIASKYKYWIRDAGGDWRPWYETDPANGTL